MVGEAIVTAVNHLLEETDWARSRLAEHSGMRARIEAPLFALSLEVVHGGRLAIARTEGIPDVTIDIPPHAALMWLTDRDTAWRAARVEGDSDFAATLSFLAANLRWDFEEDLARLLGDIAAHRIGQGLRVAVRAPRAAAEAAAHSVAEYLTEERRILATRLDIDDFVSQVDEQRDAADRLEKRIERLASKLAQH